MTKHPSSLTCVSSSSPVPLESTGDLRTWLRGDSPVKTYPRQGKVSGFLVTARGFGLRCSARLKSFGLALSSPKTPRFSALEDCRTSPKGLPAWGIASGGEFLELGTSVRRTGATECGLWPTPVARDDGKTPRAHMEMKARMKGGERYKPTSLDVMLKGVYLGAWPNPTKPGLDWKQITRGGVKTRQKSPPPNPAWKEWLMGWPIGWTALEPLETDRFQQWLRLHGKS